MVNTILNLAFPDRIRGGHECQHPGTESARSAADPICKCAEVSGPVTAIECWLGREGSNLRMAESKSAANLNEINGYSEILGPLHH
ncbi:hypothetical protein JQ607_31765 [Bradyrhizobium liaoningense]|uniref:hypothetical protein n=1 Tax=Bradyrhizobium liaoningense TaxID=43992 RepID=UPI001BADB61D|nr:hypothetical protein [Bradyrhizobium liaoningense]MBR0844799.1 hypothetical protein [Bradyrhizobium liaoningense]